MPSTDQIVYRELAARYDRKGEAQMRDRFLVLAADAALAAGQQDEAERLRLRLLQYNPHHLLKPFATFSEALKSNDVQNYVNALRRSHPPERAEHLLESLKHRADDSGTAILSPSSTAVDQHTDDTAILASPPAGEELKVFRVSEPDSAARAPIPIRPNRSFPAASQTQRPLPNEPAAESKRVVPPAKRGSSPDVFAVRPEAVLSSRSTGSMGEFEPVAPGSGVWVSVALFYVVLSFGLLLAGYTLLRPFLLN